MLGWLRNCIRGTLTMHQPAGGPQHVCQPFSRSQPAQWLLVSCTAVLTLTLAGKCFSALYPWTLLSVLCLVPLDSALGLISAQCPASGMHIRKATTHHHSACSAGTSCSESHWTCPGRQGSFGDQCVQGHYGLRCSQKDGVAHRHITSLHSL